MFYLLFLASNHFLFHIFYLLSSLCCILCELIFSSAVFNLLFKQSICFCFNNCIFIYGSSRKRNFLVISASLLLLAHLCDCIFYVFKHFIHTYSIFCIWKFLYLQSSCREESLVCCLCCLWLMVACLITSPDYCLILICGNPKGLN